MAYVKDFISLNKLSLFSVIETHVKISSADYVSSFINPRFSWIFNYDFHSNGRIWVGFDPSYWKVVVLAKSGQHVTCSVQCHSSGDSFFYLFHLWV